MILYLPQWLSNALGFAGTLYCTVAYACEPRLP